MTTETQKPKSLPVMLRQIFSRDGETLKEFQDEYRELTAKDKDWFRERIRVELFVETS